MDYECEISLLRSKRKHVTLTIQEKLDIINLVESGSCSRQTIANRYGIGKSTVHDIHKRKDILKNFAIQNSTEVAKRRRVDIKLESSKPDESYLYKEESNGIVETLVENFDHEEFDYNDEEYEIVYEPVLCNSDEMINTKPMIVTPLKHLNESSAKRKSKTLTLKEKHDILIQLDEGKSVSAIINKYGIGRTTLYDLKKQKQKVFEYIENSSGESRRTFKKSNYPEIEDGLLYWCYTQDDFTEQEFFEKYKQLFVQLKSNNSRIQTPFTGSWSWCKRFFERHPEYKKKLTASSKHLRASFKQESGNKTSDSEKFYSETESFMDDEPDIIKNTPNKKNVNYLRLDQKMQILDEVSAGKSISDVTTDFNISKSTVFDIIKKEKVIRQQSSNHENVLKRKVIKQKPQIDKQLVTWCLDQEIFPNYISITNKALELFESMGIKDFNPTGWTEKFLERNPELSKKYEESNTKSSSTSICEITDADQENSIENVDDESLEFIEADFLKSDPKIAENDEYGNEYIIEELDENNLDEFESQNGYEQEQKETKLKDESIVTEEEALSSLKVLIKYAEQKGHDEISRLLLEYQEIIEEENQRVSDT
ncbi:unnamed protein product [Chironomus riparius]|uniref:Uncharacterized protein n=1 Tax=Chironomus riparius TaxID=315576 RepID=A0A9N9WSW4_9DIPT|nr:unnamed protein product [Chironomus riparius]